MYLTKQSLWRVMAEERGEGRGERGEGRGESREEVRRVTGRW